MIIVYILYILYIQVAFVIHVDSVNDPDNELYKYITDGLTGIEELLNSPFSQVCNE